MNIQSNLAKRIISAVILAPIVLWIVWIGGWPLVAMISIACMIMLHEWYNITKTAKRKWAWWIVAFIYIILPCVFLGLIATMGPISLPIILFILLVSWTTDIGGYVFGRLIGGPKLAPKISPKKTWAGFVGGILCAVIALYIPIKIFIPFDALSIKIPFFAEIAALAMAIPASIISQLGDLFESWVKRKFGVKDSGNIIPGHGGLLDRMDGLLFVTLATALYSIVIVLIFTMPK